MDSQDIEDFLDTPGGLQNAVSDAALMKQVGFIQAPFKHSARQRLHDGWAPLSYTGNWRSDLIGWPTQHGGRREDPC